MIKAEWKKSDLKSFYSKMNKLIKEMPNSAKTGVENALESTRELILQIKPSGKSDAGILVQMIDGDEIKGRVYTDVEKFPYLVYLEFGTGLYADDEGGGSRAKKYLGMFIHRWRIYQCIIIKFIPHQMENNIILFMVHIHIHLCDQQDFKAEMVISKRSKKQISEMIRRVVK